MYRATSPQKKISLPIAESLYIFTYFYFIGAYQNKNDMSKQLELQEGTEVTINMPFTYEIGDEGNFTNKTLMTIEDCEDEIRAEIDEGMSGCNVMLQVEKEFTMNDRVKKFIDKFCIECKDEHDDELMMDDHKCVDWEGVEYFMPENNSGYTDEDDFIWKILNECYHV